MKDVNNLIAGIRPRTTPNTSADESHHQQNRCQGHSNQRQKCCFVERHGRSIRALRMIKVENLTSTPDRRKKGLAWIHLAAKQSLLNVEGQHKIRRQGRYRLLHQNRRLGSLAELLKEYCHGQRNVRNRFNGEGVNLPPGVRQTVKRQCTVD